MATTNKIARFELQFGLFLIFTLLYAQTGAQCQPHCRCGQAVIQPVRFIAVDCSALPSASDSVTIRNRAYDNCGPIREEMVDQQSPGQQQSSALPNGRLDSWKEIAAYLNRDVTTVQRWEKREGMPVHRHLHGRMGSVYAYRADLDAWVNSRNVPLAPDATEQLLRSTTPTTPKKRRFAL